MFFISIRGADLGNQAQRAREQYPILCALETLCDMILMGLYVETASALPYPVRSWQRPCSLRCHVEKPRDAACL